MSATLTTVSNILKDLYLPPIQDQLQNEVLLLNRLETRSQELVGNQAVVPLHVGRSAAIGGRAEGGALPATDYQRYAKAVYDLKYLYGRIGVTGPSMAKTASEAGAFVRVLEGEINGMRMDLKKDLARQVYGSGNALIAQCGTTTTSNDVVLGSAEAIQKGWLSVGMIIDIGTTASEATIADGVSITAVNAATPTITISGSTVSTTSSHYVSRKDSRSGTTSYEIDGIKKIVASSATSFGGINPATAGNEYWDNLRMTNSGTARPLTLDLLQQAWGLVRINSGETSLMVTSFGVQRAFYNLLQSQVRYVEPTRLAGGFEALEFMGKPLVADIDAPWGEVYFLSEDHLKVFAPNDWHFLEEDGSVLKYVSGYDKWEAVLAKYMNLGATRRNVQLLLDDITDTTGY